MMVSFYFEYWTNRTAGKFLLNRNNGSRQERWAMFHTIGETSGEIWKLLEKEGPFSISALSKKIAQPQSIVYMGIGWLAREGKLVFSETKRGLSISAKR